MKRPNLITEYDPDTLNTQQRQWRGIVSMGDEIEMEIRHEAWQNAMDIAEERQHQVARFFLEGVCSSLFKQIMQDVSAMKHQLDGLLELARHKGVRFLVPEPELLAPREADGHASQDQPR